MQQGFKLGAGDVDRCFGAGGVREAFACAPARGRGRVSGGGRKRRNSLPEGFCGDKKKILFRRDIAAAGLDKSVPVFILFSRLRAGVLLSPSAGAGSFGDACRPTVIPVPCDTLSTPIQPVVVDAFECYLSQYWIH